MFGWLVAEPNLHTHSKMYMHDENVCALFTSTTKCGKIENSFHVPHSAKLYNYKFNTNYSEAKSYAIKWNQMNMVSTEHLVH